MSSQSAKDIQSKRARTDFEYTLGDKLWDVIRDEKIDDVNVRPNGKVIYMHADRGRETHPELTYTPEESEDLARAILQCQNPTPMLNTEQQSVDCKMMLSDGEHFARVHIDGPPSVSPGHQICIRKQKVIAPTLESWVERDYMKESYLDVFRWTVEARLNVIFCGKMFTGKTTLRNGHFGLIKKLDPSRAMIEILDVNETVCDLDDYVPLYINRHRSASDHCRAFVRMSSECVGVNELRGPEAYDLVHNLWISGHNGSSTTMHASNPEEALWRCSTLIGESGKVAQRDVLAEAIDVMVFLRYAPEIGRRVTQIVHVKGIKSDGSVDYVDLAERFEWPGELDSKTYIRKAA